MRITMTLPGAVERPGNFDVAIKRSECPGAVRAVERPVSYLQIAPTQQPAWVRMSPRSPSYASTASTASTALSDGLDSLADCLKNCKYAELKEQFAREQSKIVCEAAARPQECKPVNLRKRRNMSHLSINVAVCKKKLDLRATDSVTKQGHKSTKGIGLGERMTAKMFFLEHKVQSIFQKFASRGHI